MIKIYALKHNGIMFYIGQSFDPQKRLLSHIVQAKEMITHKDKFISSLIANNKRIEVEVLRSCNKQDALKYEQQEIEKCMQSGIILFNCVHAVKYKITDIELRILQLLADDNHSYELTNIVWLSVRSIETIRRRVINKLNCNTISGAIYKAYKLRLIR